MWEKPQPLRFSLIPSLLSKYSEIYKVLRVKFVCTMFNSSASSPWPKQPTLLFTWLALLIMVYFSICTYSSNMTPGDGWRQSINHPHPRPSHDSSRGFLPWKKACDKVISFLWLSQIGHYLTNPGSHLLCTLLQHCECHLLHLLEWVGLILWPLWKL